jgi:hypothetical protein
MRLRTLGFLAVLILAVPTSVFAQRQALSMTAEEMTRLTISQLFKKVQLTDLQQKRAEELIAAWRLERMRLDPNASDRRRQVDSLKVRWQTKLREILDNDADRRQFDENQREEAAQWAPPQKPASL